MALNLTTDLASILDPIDGKSTDRDVKTALITVINTAVADQELTTIDYILNLGVNLPVADPVVAGALWNDAGTVKVSAGV